MGRCPLLIVLIVQVAVILIADLAGWRRPQQPPGFGVNDYAATVISTREAKTSGQLLVARIDSIGGAGVAPFKARVHVVSEIPGIYPGQRIRFGAKLGALPVVPDVPDIVDLQKNLRRQGVVASAVVPVDSIRYIASANRLKEWFARANESLMCRIGQSPLEPQTINILAAMLLGRGHMLDDTTRADYSAAGMSHVLALSGLHVGIIAMIIAFALWPFYFGRHVRTRLMLTVLALWFYVALTGFIPSVTRSVIMVSVYMFGRILQRRSSSFNSLCLAAILILLFVPEDIYSAGFQLSFAAVAGIIMFYPLLNRVDRRRHPQLYMLASYPALSVSAMLFAGIVSTFYFHAFPVYFLFANLLIVPIVPLLILSGILSLLFRVDFGADLLCRAMDGVSDFFSELPAAVLPDLYPPSWLIILLLAILTLLAYGLHRRSLFLAIEASILFAGILACCAVMPHKVYPEREIYEIAEYRSRQTIVVEGDSCFIHTTATLPADRKEIEARYQLILRDFVAKRHLPTPILK